MNKKQVLFNRCFALLILVNLTVFALAVVLRVGIGATPYNTTDSVGRPMGFNDPLHPEHYIIMLRNFTPAELLKFEYGYEWLLFAMQILGAALLLRSTELRSRLCRWFFVAQVALFPFGVLALPLLPSLIVRFLTGHLDREDFVDIPFIVAVAHPIWVVSSLIIALGLRGPGLGLSRVWNALILASRAAARTFADAIR